jgi:hypothetical protein
MRFGHRVIVQRRAVGIISRTTDKVGFNVKRQVTLVAEPRDNALNLGHDFGANAVTGQDQKGGVRHCNKSFLKLVA